MAQEQLPGQPVDPLAQGRPGCRRQRLTQHGTDAVLRHGGQEVVAGREVAVDGRVAHSRGFGEQFVRQALERGARRLLELKSKGTTVTALLAGMIDTPMSERWDVPKVSAADVVAQAYDDVVAGAFEVHADADTRQVKALLGASAEDFNAALEEALSSFVP
jgi:hypothetical protein